MASRNIISFSLLITLSLFSLHSTADDTDSSVFFLDSSSHPYFRSHPSADENNVISLPEVGAAVSVLLGFAPPATLTAASSEKLNELLMPKPFDKPRAVFVLEINGAKDMHPMGLDHNVFSSAIRNGIAFGQNKDDIQLEDQEEVSLVSLNEPLDSECTDKELIDFASWLSGSYVSKSVEPLSGELTIPLSNGVQLNLHLSKKADREFATGIVSIIRNLQHAMLMRQDLSGDMPNPAELLTGRFNGLKALLEHYGPGEIVLRGMELLTTSLSKIFVSLQTAYKGQIVGVILFNGTPQPESESMLSVKFASRAASPRRLEEERGSPKSPIIIAEVLLVRQTLAWLTGIILLIATLLGTCFLLNMPLTKDTLLYSNVKLD